MGPVDVSNLFYTCWDNVQTHHATLVADIDSTIQADRSPLPHLLGNLFKNAIDHGGDDVNVCVGELDDGFYVEDDGPGIPASDREGVLEAGYSTSESITGLGLSIVREIGEAHGWEIRVTESTDGGARFEITEMKVTAK